jgi:O-antigen/teichoic acid export membrane protein
VTRLLGQVTTLLLYGASPLVVALAPFAVVPAVTSRYGADGWAACAVALSVGAGTAVVAELGWVVVGPQRVSRDPARHAEVHHDALASRLVALIVLAPIAAVAVALLVDEHRVAAVLLTLGVAGGALSPTWLFVGLGRPGLTLVCEAVPRVVLALTAASVIALGGPLEAYGLAALAAVAVTLVATGRALGVRRVPTCERLRAVPSIVRGQLVVTTGRGVTALYKTLPAALLQSVAPGSVAAFGAIDRLVRAGLGVIAIVPQRLQVWVGTPDAGLAARRTVRSLAVNTALGLISAGIVLIALPPVVDVLFTGVVEVEAPAVGAAALLVGLTCSSRAFGLALVTLGAVRVTTTAALAAAAVGVTGVLWGGATGGATGALLGVAAAEAVAVAVQAAVVVPLVVGSRRASSGSAE